MITRLELGGAQQNTLYCVRHHDRERFRVGLLAGSGGLLDEEALRIPQAEIRLLTRLRHPIHPLWDPIALLELRAWFRRTEVDLVHTHSSKAGIIGRLAAHLAGVPAVVHTVHGWSFNATQPAGRRRLYIALERLAARWTDRLIVVADSNRREGLEHGIGRGEQYELLRSGIDADEFRTPGRERSAVRAELGIEPEQILVGSLICFKPQKAPLDFVRAAAWAHAREPRLRFILAGDGPLRPAVEDEVRRLALTGVVRLLGWRRDVIDLLHAMDAFFLTSLFEGLPRSVLQAMAAGVPVVATAVDGIPEVVEHGCTGWLVPPGRPAEAAAGLLDCVGDAPRRGSCVERARARLTSDFDLGRMVRRLEQVYLELLSSRASSRPGRRPRGPGQ